MILLFLSVAMARPGMEWRLEQHGTELAPYYSSFDGCMKAQPDYEGSICKQIIARSPEVADDTITKETSIKESSPVVSE